MFSVLGFFFIVLKGIVATAVTVCFLRLLGFPMKSAFKMVLTVFLLALSYLMVNWGSALFCLFFFPLFICTRDFFVLGQSKAVILKLMVWLLLLQMTLSFFWGMPIALLLLWLMCPQPCIGYARSLGVYVINLDRSPKRLSYVWPVLEQLGWDCHRVCAFDGRRMKIPDGSVVDGESYARYSGGIQPGKGTIACALSHIEAWKTFLASSHSHALICEDDISFDPSILQPVLNDIIQLTFWDICMLDISHRGGPLRIKTLHTGQELCLYSFNIAHAGCYVLTRQAAKRLLDKALPLRMPIDHILTRPWEFPLRLIGIEPRLVQQTYGNSDIASADREKKPEQRSRIQKIRRFLFIVKSSGIRFLYALYTYIGMRLWITMSDIKRRYIS